MRILRERDKIASFLRVLRKRAAGVSPETEQRVRDILAAVKKKGDRAVEGYTRTFDGHELPLTITAAEIRKYARKTDEKIVKALTLSAKRIEAFHKRQRESS
ncbi:MAG TPA: histidinol dehydrogenase, partial [Dissulfurispiraceae bacterium]|nr:histidinol dehydrogenase [Dissulfurispiraceae bacterium]